MNKLITRILLFGLFSFLHIHFSHATDYYFHPRLGDDNHSGISAKEPLKSLSKVQTLTLQAGDRILLAGGETFVGNLEIKNFLGNEDTPLIINSYFPEGVAEQVFARIDAKGFSQAILLENSSNISVSHLQLTANGYGLQAAKGEMRVGVLVLATGKGKVKNILLENLTISKVFFEEPGISRDAEEVKSANGTQRYGWGIRLMNQSSDGLMENVKILNNNIDGVSHTGIKLTGGQNQSVRNITISGNKVHHSGGPGIQMSGVKFVYVSENEVLHSGSTRDSRNWGRGSGLWTWGASMVLIEKNKFMYANGPGDSAGAHIDFNCDNIVLQYNLSAHNAGGFAEILGNNYNCAYRYNISVNDGHRVKGQNGAFQEGKLLWLSGYQGNMKERKGPVNSYFYNNTMYVNAEILSKFAIDNRSKGILIANNIFHILGETELVSGDQYRPDDEESRELDQVFFSHNLFLKAGLWPASDLVEAKNSLIGNADFSNPGGLNPEDYIPQNRSLIKNGIEIPSLMEDHFGLIEGLNLTEDILGNPIPKKPGIGAIYPFEKLSNAEEIKTNNLN